MAVQTTGDTKEELLLRAWSEFGVKVTPGMFEGYERNGFILPPALVGGGYKGGVRGVYRPEDLRTIVALPVMLPYCRRSLRCAAVGAWSIHDCPVPWKTVRRILERMLTTVMAAARRSPGRASQGVLKGWIGKTVLQGHPAKRRSQANALVTEMLGEMPASTTIIMLEIMIRMLGADSSSVASGLTFYDVRTGQYDTIPNRSSMPAILKSIQSATEDAAQAVRPMVLWIIIWISSLFNALQKTNPLSVADARRFVYSTAPVALALLLHLRATVPSEDWRTFSTRLPATVRAQISAEAEVSVHEYPFRKDKDQKG